MSVLVLVCGNVFDGLSDALTGPAEILVEGNRIAKVEQSVGRPPGSQVIDLSERTVSPGFIDTHVHLTMDAANLALQTLQSSAAKALAGLSLAREYMDYGFTTLRDLGSVDPEWPTVDLRNALNSGLVEGPRLFVAAHIISASAGHGDLRGFYASRWTLPVSAIADDRREHQSACAARAHLRQRLDQDGEHRRVFQRRRRSGAGDVVRRRDGSADVDRPPARHACRRSHRRRRRMQAGHPLRRAQYRTRLSDRRRGDRDGGAGRSLYRPDDADDPGGPARTASRHAAMPGGVEVSARQRGNPRVPAVAGRKRCKSRLRHRLRHVSVQPRHSGIPGDGQGGAELRARLEGGHQRCRRAPGSRRSRRARPRQTRRYRRHARRPHRRHRRHRQGGFRDEGRRRLSRPDHAGQRA